MSTLISRATVGMAVMCVAGLVFAGCGGSDDSSGTSADSARQTVDSAVSSCKDSAQNLGGAAGTALESACEQIGSTFTADLSDSGDDVDAARADAVEECNQVVDSLPAGDAQAALSSLCDSVDSTGDGG